MNTAAVKDKARAVSDLNAGSIIATVEIAANPERVFQALMGPEVAKWWGADGHYRVTEWTADLRVGGTWMSKGKGADGKEFTVQGKILEFDPPHKVVKTWNYDWEEGAQETKLTYQLEAIEGGTRVKVQHTGFGSRKKACEDHANGWEQVLGWLVEYVHSTKWRMA
jgi:uncharacterized protein YndB with AHSA1/START domain